MCNSDAIGIVVPVHFKFCFFIHMVHGSMNYMNSKDKLQITKKSMQNLSRSICDFIGYWQFRRFHGAIWTQLYLCKTPLSCTDHIIRTRESKQMKQITTGYSAFLKEEALAGHISDNRIKSLGEIILSANMMLEMIMSQKNIMEFSMELKNRSNQNLREHLVVPS